MWVQVEELIPLVADEVMTTAWTAACDADGLRHFQGCFQRGVVDGCDAVDSEADAEEDEGGLEGVLGVFLCGGGDEGVDVDVAVVGPSVDADPGGGVFVCEGSG